MKTRHRLLLALVVVALVAAALVAAGSIGIIRGAVRTRFADRLHAETTLLATRLRHVDSAQLQSYTDDAGRALGTRVTLIAPDGSVLADSTGDLTDAESHLDRPEIVSAALRGSGMSTRTSDTTRVAYLYVARTVDAHPDVRFVRLAIPTNQIDLAQSRHGWSVVPLTLVALLAVVAFGYVGLRRIATPLEQLASDIERVAGGDFGHRIRASDNEEVERLARSAGRMQSALVQKIGEVDEERTLLFSVISGMREGLALVGADRRIRLANASLRKILALEHDPEGLLLAEVIRHPEIIADVETALDDAQEVDASTIRLPSPERRFDLHVTPLGSDDSPGARQVLILLFDITRLERLEQVRREFVSNVSHELRTPLTSIKAFVENLLDGGLDDPETARRFLEIALKHTDRMSELIEDLTDLSLIETGAIPMKPSSIDAAATARRLVEQLTPLAADHQVRLRVDFSSSLPLTADPRRLDQMLTNLVTNAIKFNKPDGEVVLTGGMIEGHPTIMVRDTGIGIPESSRDRVFNRFYQVDTGRSPNRSGTGLGLAIVKHLMRLHGGTVHLRSELGSGSTFELQFPKVGWAPTDG